MIHFPDRARLPGAPARVGAASVVIAAALGATMALALLAPPAMANPALDGKPPVMRGIKLHEGRHTIAPQLGMTINDPYVRNFMAGVAYRYFPTAWLGLGVDVWGGGGVETALTEDINRELSRGAQSFQLGTSSLRLLANAAIELIPLTGKAVVFSGRMVRFEVHLNLGVGVAMTAGSGRLDDEISIAPMFGVGIRIFPSDWLAIGVDLRDYLVNRVLASRRDGSVPGATFDHNWQLGLSVGFFFPTEPEFAKD